MNKSKKNIVICSPYLSAIGGTEIEAILTAIELKNSNKYNKITVFSGQRNINPFFYEILKNTDIILKTYPIFMEFRFMIFIKRILKKITKDSFVIEKFFWFFLSFKFDVFFILTYPQASYFFPLMYKKKYNKKYFAKITMHHFDQLSNQNINLYKKFNNIIVFNETQKKFWIENNKLSQTIALDIMILNEKNLLELPIKKIKKNIVFGYLGRISEEKNIEDMIRLIYFLDNSNQNCKLIIQGQGEDKYISKIKKIIYDYALESKIEFKNLIMNPMDSQLFYHDIDVFLVTSHNEGGPMTALEAAAAGCYLSGYDIGAMQARFGSFLFIVNKNFDELCRANLDFINLSDFEKNDLVTKLREHYKTSLNNSIKRNQLHKIFE